jgi:CheY-like chemotaxis protein
VAVTGHAREEDRRRAIEAGFDHYLVKPGEPDQLRKVLAEFTLAVPTALG